MACGDVLSLEDLQTAKKHQIFEAEIITGKAGGIAGGASIDYATNQVTGQTQKTLPAVLRDAGFRPASVTFVTGGVLAVGDSDMAVLWPVSAGGDGQYYIWKGAYPKTVPANSTPATSGGVSDSGWLQLGDITLRGDLAKSTGQLLVGRYGSVAEMKAATNPSGYIVKCKRYYSGGESVAGLEYISMGAGWPEVADGFTTHADAGGNFLRLVGDRVSAKTSGMKGDNTSDDSAAFNAAYVRAKTLRVELFFEKGRYLVPTANTMNGKTVLRGESGARLIGNLLYEDLTFAAAADITVPLTEQVPFFSSSGIDYQTLNNSYALTVRAQIQTKFIDTGDVTDARFYGKYGLWTENLVTFSIRDSWFYNSVVGAKSTGCTNFDIDGCRWRNQAAIGYHIEASSGFRTGGENLRFSKCEFDVCSIGILADRHKWLSIESCLFDYCQLPLYLLGSIYTKMSKSYFGAAKVSGTLSAIPGYAAAPTTGVAIYARPHVNGATVTPCGFSANNCELVNYVVGSTLPIVLADGDVPSVPSARPIERTSLRQCKVLTAENHAMAYMVSISKCQVANLDDVEFISPDKSSTLLAPYSLNLVDSFSAENSNTWQCTQSGVRVIPTDERTIIGDEHTWVAQNGDVCMRILSTGSDRLQVYVGGAFKSVGVGATNSAGTGFRQLIVPN